MFSKLLLVAAISLTSAVAYTQEAKKDTKAEEKKEVTDLSNQNFAYTAFDYIKKTFTASYHGEYYFTRPVDPNTGTIDYAGDKAISDLRIMHNPTVIYRPTDKWRVLATGEFKYTDAVVQGSFVNDFYRALYSVTREKIMTEKEDGMGLSVGIVRRQFNHTKVSSYGNNRVNATISKTLAGKHPASLMVQYLRNDPVESKINSNTWKHGYNLLPTITYQISDKVAWLFNDDFVINTPWNDNTAQDYTISHDMNIGYITYTFNDKNTSYFQFKYLHTDNFNQINDSTDEFPYYIGHSYSFTPKFTVTAEMGSNMFVSSDNRFFAEALKYPEFALYLDFAL